jgi:SAM-dependent methyltransferase
MQQHYGAGVELDRLLGGSSRIEFARTKELLERFLPPPPSRVLDVGGGPGRYAAWLAGSGYSVHLIDPVPLHVEQATAAAAGLSNPFTASTGDARRLDVQEGAFEAALLLGPLYHLTERSERLAALAEARRALRPNGIVVAAAISRFASLLHGLINGDLADPTFAGIVERDLREGQHRNPTDRPEWFTEAFFHHPDELREEIADAGLVLEGLFGVEGPGWLVSGLWDDPERREHMLQVARAVEQEPTAIGVSAHLLAVARRSG